MKSDVERERKDEDEVMGVRIETGQQ